MSRPITCFLVDDDKDDQEIFALALERIDPSILCFTADDGHFALQKFQSEPGFVPDLIFLDLNMPRINGIQCLEEIRKKTALQNTPVIIYTTSSHEKDKKLAGQLGAQDFITKFTDIDELCDCLRLMFEKHLKRNNRSA